MFCQKCNSIRILHVYGKCSDLCVVQLGDKEKDGYVPSDMGIGGGDDIDFNVCLDCGQLQGTWPLPQTILEGGIDPEEDDWEREDREDREQDEAQRRVWKSQDAKEPGILPRGFVKKR